MHCSIGIAPLAEVTMHSKAATILEIELDDPTNEQIFLRWWEAARVMLKERFAATSHDLIVLGRGRYLAITEFPLPETWARVDADPRWQELERSRPEATLQVTKEGSGPVEQPARCIHHGAQRVDHGRVPPASSISS